VRYYDGHTLTATIVVSDVRSEGVTEVALEGDTLDEGGVLSGVRGVLARARLAKHSLDEVRQAPASQWWKAAPSQALQTLASFGSQLDHLVLEAGTDGDRAGGEGGGGGMAAFREAVEGVGKRVEEAVRELEDTEEVTNARRLAYARALLNVWDERH
jgi:hypothetical protein